MARYTNENRRPHDEEDDEDLPEGVYHDDDEDLPTIRCPYCRAEILEDSPRCPRCENYLSREDSPGEPKSYFWIIMMTLAMACATFWLLF